MNSARAFDTAVCTELAAVDADESRGNRRRGRGQIRVQSRQVGNRSRQRRVAVRQIRSAVPRARKILNTRRIQITENRANRRVDRVVPSTSRPSLPPVASALAPSRLPSSSTGRPARPTYWSIAPSRTDPMSPEKSASDVRASRRVSVSFSDADRSPAAARGRPASYEPRRQSPSRSQSSPPCPTGCPTHPAPSSSFSEDTRSARAVSA